MTIAAGRRGRKTAGAIALGVLFAWHHPLQAEEAAKDPRPAPLAMSVRVLQGDLEPKLLVAVANVSTKNIRIPDFFLEGWDGACEGRQNLRYELFDSTGKSLLYRCHVRAGSMQKADFSVLLEPGDAFARVVSGLGCFQMKEGEIYHLVVRYVVGCPSDGMPPKDAFLGDIAADPERRLGGARGFPARAALPGGS